MKEVRMNPVVDELAVEFTSSDDFYAYVEDREKHAKWLDPTPISAVKFVPAAYPMMRSLEAEFYNRDANDANYIDAYDDTTEGSKMAIETPDGGRMLLRTNALAQAKQRLCIEGSVFNSFSPDQTALVLNTCASVNKKPVLVRFADEKATGFLSANSYAIISSVDVYQITDDVMRNDLFGSFIGGFYSHTFMDANFLLDENRSYIKKTLNRYREITDNEDLQMVCSVRTSDTGNCAVTIDPRLYNADKRLYIPLGASLRTEHKGEKALEDIHESFSMLQQSMEKAQEKLEALADTEIHYAALAMMRALKKVQLPCAASMKVVELFCARNGEYDQTALSIYLAAQEVVSQIALESDDPFKMYRAQDALARLLGVKWESLDYAGTLEW